MPSWLFPSLRGYQTQWVRGDLLAGLTVWAVLVPEALAYATIAGVSPVVGLYAAPGALLFYAAFGGSRHLIVGPMSATAALSAAVVATYATAGSDQFTTITAALALTGGIVAVLAGLMRLGFLANFISEPVMKGFIVGLALTIIAGQLPTLFGVEKGSGDFFQKVWDLITKLGDTQVLTLVIGLLSLAIVLGLRRWAPAIPGSLAAVLFGVLMVELFSLNKHGVEIVGHIDSGLPTLGFPSLSFQQYLKLAGSSVAVVLVGFAEGLGAAKTYAAKHHYEIDASQEMIGVGAANIAAGLSSGMIVNGSLSKTAVNGSSGARSQVSGLVTAAMTVVTLLLLTGLFEKLPEATLAAIVIAAVVELVDYRSLIRLWGLSSRRLHSAYGVASRPDFIAAMAALLGVTIFDTLPGLIIGIVTSLILLVYWASRPRFAELGRVPGSTQYTDLSAHPDNEVTDGTVVVRVESGLFFANADWVRSHLRTVAARPGTRVIILDAAAVAFIDVTAVEMLDQVVEDLRTRGVQLLIARDLGTVRDILRTSGAEQQLQVVYPSVRAAVAAAESPDTGTGSADQNATPPGT